MTWTAISTQNPGDGWTSTKVNQWVKGNVEHLAGMLIHGTAISALAGGSELLGNVSRWVYTETRASNGDFSAVTLSGLAGYTNATGFICEIGIRSSYATGVAGDTMAIEVNGDTTATNYYSQRFGMSDATTVMGESNDNSLGVVTNANSPSGAWYIGEFRCNNMKDTAMWKSIKIDAHGQLDTSTQRIDNGGVFWKNTAAMTSFFINLASGTPVTSSYLRVRFIF